MGPDWRTAESNGERAHLQADATVQSELRGDLRDELLKRGHVVLTQDPDHRRRGDLARRRPSECGRGNAQRRLGRQPGKAARLVRADDLLELVRKQLIHI